MFEIRECRILGCVREDGTIVRKFIVTKADFAAFSLEAAIDNHFTMSRDDQDNWIREVTPEIIALETRHETWARTVLHPGTLRVTDEGIEQHDDFPPDASYREAWIYDEAGRVIHDMSKARSLFRSRLRRARQPLLAALDVEYQRADESGDRVRKADVAARKQALRDAPENPAIDAAKTIDDLKQIVLP